jgi:hypothetical protein
MDDMSSQSTNRSRGTSFESLGSVEGEGTSDLDICIRSQPSCTFSAQSFCVEDLRNAGSIDDLSNCKNCFTSVNVDPYMMGLGGDDEWFLSYDEKLLIPPSKYEFQLLISAGYADRK